jgi:hypothetical protein
VQILVDSESTSDKAPPTAQQLGIMLQNVQGIRIGSNAFFVRASQNQEASLRPTPGIYRFAARNNGQWFVKSAMYGTTNLLQDNMAITWGAVSAPIVVTVSNRMGGLQGGTELKGAAASAWIYLIPGDPRAVPFYSGHSNMDGVFSFPNLPPGSYEAIAFEDRYLANYSDPKVLNLYATYIRNVTVTVGGKATVNLDVVPDAEMHR